MPLLLGLSFWLRTGTWWGKSTWGLSAAAKAELGQKQTLGSARLCSRLRRVKVRLGGSWAGLGAGWGTGCAPGGGL